MPRSATTRARSDEILWNLPTLPWLGFDLIERSRCVTKISQHSDVVTLINVFTVAPEDQQRLLDLLTEATES
jgi:hypothetical protein